MTLSTNYEVLESIISTHASILSPHEYFNEVKESGMRISSSYQVTTSKHESLMRPEEQSELIVEKDKEISSIIVRLSTAEQQRFEMERLRNDLERENQNLRYDIEIMRERLEGDASKSVSNIQEVQNKLNKDWERRIQSNQENYEKEM